MQKLKKENEEVKICTFKVYLYQRRLDKRTHTTATSGASTQSIQSRSTVNDASSSSRRFDHKCRFDDTVKKIS